MIRSPLLRTVPTAEPKPPKGPRPRKCSNCGTSFTQQRMGQQVCSPPCAQSFARRLREQQERKADKARKQAMKSRRDWLKEAQVAFNAFVRQRDASEPCISCGRHHEGQYHAGHFRSVGAQPALRFNELNVHKQCAPCNNHKSGNIVEYRIRLLQKIGREAVEFLEIEHAPARWTIEELQAIKAQYKLKLKQLKETTWN